MSTRSSARIKKVSIRCNGNVDSVPPDQSEGEDTIIGVTGIVAVFKQEYAEENGTDDCDGEHSVSSNEL